MEEAKKKRTRAVKQTKTSGLEAPKKLKILVTIINREKADFYMSILESFDVNLQTMLFAEGTAPTEVMRVLGLNDKGKSVLFSIVDADKINDILAQYEDNYFKTKNGQGIAFTIPIKSVIGVMAYQFLANIKTEEEKK